jgi:hypothetical protein
VTIESNYYPICAARRLNANRRNESFADSSSGTLLTPYHVDHGAPPNKRIKYNDLKPEIQQPLRIDTAVRSIHLTILSTVCVWFLMPNVALFCAGKNGV